MTEIDAEVFEEKVLGPTFEPFILQWIGQNNPGASPIDSLEHAIQEAEDCRKDGYTCRILRVRPPSPPIPPKKQRVEIDWESIIKEVHGAHNKLRGIGSLGVVAHELRGHVIQELIEANARIVEEPKP